MTTDRRKFDSLCKVLDEDNPFMAIIFCRTKRRADKLEEDMGARGYNCEKYIVIYHRLKEKES